MVSFTMKYDITWILLIRLTICTNGTEYCPRCALKSGTSNMSGAYDWESTGRPHKFIS